MKNCKECGKDLEGGYQVVFENGIKVSRYVLVCPEHGIVEVLF